MVNSRTPSRGKLEPDPPVPESLLLNEPLQPSVTASEQTAVLFKFSGKYLA
jgi:hypothetical protein